MEKFNSNAAVAFGDVNLSEEQIQEAFGVPQNPGAGGWPTIRYYNKETGYGGKPYEKKTGDAMCTELGNDEYMQAYVEEAGGTSLCSAETGEGCGDKEKAYIEKFKAKSAEEVEAQRARLVNMKSGKMKPELKQWLTQRLAILKQLAKTPAHTEL